VIKGVSAIITSPYKELKDLSWYPFSDEPLIQGLWYVPRLSSVVFLFPEESVDEKWHLFAHSYLGIQHFQSTSGIVWEPVGLIQVRGKYPHLYYEKGIYHLVYERHGHRIPFVENIKRKRPQRVVGSHIELRSSADLVVWSEPRVILQADQMKSADAYRKKPTLSHPQLVPVEGGYRLYVGTSKKGKDPQSTRYVCSAFSPTIDGVYEPEGDTPIIEAEPNDQWRNLAAGRVSFYKGDNIYVALQNGRYWDPQKQKEGSAISLLQSKDGLKWTRCSSEPILVPSDRGWAMDHIISCDVRYKEDESCWYCYFTATGEKKTFLVRESIGLLIGKIPALRKQPSH
jgi:hypothetical protein